MRAFFKAIRDGFRYQNAKHSFSQRGEDLIVADIFKNLRIARPTYLDIGAHHPSYLSNTYHFYLHGASGVCIEPNPLLADVIKKTRPRDTVLPIGVGDKDESHLPFYVMTTPTLSTFSKTEADNYVSSQNYGTQNIERVLEVPLRNINSIIESYFKEPPAFISLDTEGMDYDILSAINFGNIRPIVFCIETGRQSAKATFHRDERIISFMENQGYLLYADTHTNSIFLDKNKWTNF